MARITSDGEREVPKFGGGRKLGKKAASKPKSKPKAVKKSAEKTEGPKPKRERHSSAKHQAQMANKLLDALIELAKSAAPKGVARRGYDDEGMPASVEGMRIGPLEAGWRGQAHIGQNFPSFKPYIRAGRNAPMFGQPRTDGYSLQQMLGLDGPHFMDEPVPGMPDYIPSDSVAYQPDPWLPPGRIPRLPQDFDLYE